MPLAYQEIPPPTSTPALSDPYQPTSRCVFRPGPQQRASTGVRGARACRQLRRNRALYQGLDPSVTACGAG